MGGDQPRVGKRLSEFKVVDTATAVNADMAVDADKLDGKSSAAFVTKNVYDSDQDGVLDLLPRAAFNSANGAPDGANFTLSTTITAPAPRILILSGQIDANNFVAIDFYNCRLEIDDGLVSGTWMFAILDGKPTSNGDENCTTTGAAVVGAGTYVIDFEVSDVEGTTSLGHTSVWALWVPLDGTGAIPAP